MGQPRSTKAFQYCSISLLAALGAFAAPQDNPQQDPSPHAWRRASELSADQSQPSQAAPEPVISAEQAGPPEQGPPPPPNFSANQQGGYAPGNYPPPPGNYPPPQRGYPQGASSQRNYPAPQGGYQQPMQEPYSQQSRVAIPAQLTIRPGTFLNVRMNQGLSSDHNQQGDPFRATLAEPLVVDGVVVAQRGETVMGRVTDAQKAGRVQGTSRLGVELTSVTLVDGQQLPLQSQMVSRNGQTSVGSDVGAVAGTTALGAVVGAAADWGRGAAIGAGAGAAAGLLGVLLTRGHPTVVYPETVLTFRVSAPATLVTDKAPQAFRYVQSQDYNHNAYVQGPPARQVAPAPYYGGGYYYGPSYSPYYYGPSASFYFGPSWYGGYRGGIYYRGRR